MSHLRVYRVSRNRPRVGLQPVNQVLVHLTTTVRRFVVAIVNLVAKRYALVASVREEEGKNLPKQTSRVVALLGRSRSYGGGGAEVVGEMRGDSWAGKFCCQIECLAGPVDLSNLDELARRWVRECFHDSRRPVVEWFVATGPPFTVVPVDETVVADSAVGISERAGDDFADGIFAEFLRRSGVRATDGVPDPFGPEVITVVLGASQVALIYGHSWGDETVLYPKTRRLLLAIAGRITPTPPPLTDQVDLSGTRVARAVLDVVRRKPADLVHAARAIAAGRKGRARTCSGRAADPNSTWMLTVQLLANDVGKIPSVLLYCRLLKELGVPASVTNHVIADVRAYSPSLASTGGNAISHVPFSVDWSVDTPESVATSIGTRLRRGEPAFRFALSRAVGSLDRLKGRSKHRLSDTQFATTMSYFRLPPGQLLTRGDSEVRTLGLQTPSLGMLSCNARDYGGRAYLALSHRGRFIGPDEALRAVIAAVDQVGCRVAWTKVIDSEAVWPSAAEPPDLVRSQTHREDRGTVPTGR